MKRARRIFRGEAVIFLAVLALATDEPPLSVASAKTAGVAKACFQKITASEKKAAIRGYTRLYSLNQLKCLPKTWILGNG